MISRINAFLIALLLILVIRLYPNGDYLSIQGSMVFSLGFLILSGYLLGEILSAIQLPRISGYLFAGMLMGPYVSGLLSKEAVREFTLIDQIALGLIALTAGGELNLSTFKHRIKSILSITLNQTVIVFLFSTLASYWLLIFLPEFQAFSDIARFSASMVFGVIAVTQSPATTIAIVTETKSSGKCTDHALGVTILVDVIVIVLFTLILMMASVLERGVGALNWMQFVVLGGEILFSIVVGILSGILISYFLEHIQLNPVLFLLAFCFLMSLASKTIHLDALIIFVTAGIWVRNATQKGKTLIKTIENGSLIVYVIFFCVTGANVNLHVLYNLWSIALVLVGLRIVFVFFSTWLGITLAKESVPSIATFWMMYVPQAGVSLGLIALVSDEFGAWAVPLKTIVIASIAINQIIGPIMMKYAIMKSGEVDQAG